MTADLLGFASLLPSVAILVYLFSRYNGCWKFQVNMTFTVLVLMVLNLMINYSEAEPT